MSLNSRLETNTDEKRSDHTLSPGADIRQREDVSPLELSGHVCTITLVSLCMHVGSMRLIAPSYWRRCSSSSSLLPSSVEISDQRSDYTLSPGADIRQREDVTPREETRRVEVGEGEHLANCLREAVLGPTPALCYFGVVGRARVCVRESVCVFV